LQQGAQPVVELAQNLIFLAREENEAAVGWVEELNSHVGERGQPLTRGADRAVRLIRPSSEFLHEEITQVQDALVDEIREQRALEQRLQVVLRRRVALNAEAMPLLFIQFDEQRQLAVGQSRWRRSERRGERRG
jgi:hypothetical protein